MDSVLKEFLDKAKRAGLCSEYTGKVDRAASKKAFMDIALDANGLSWVADKVNRGLLSSDYIAEAFAPFLNGAYIRDCGDGYTASLYCKPTSEVHITTTAALIIDCTKDIFIDRAVCELHIVGSKASILGKGRAVTYLYGSEIANSDTSSAIVKEQI